MIEKPLKKKVTKYNMKSQWNYLSYTNKGMLKIEGWWADELVNKVGTPAYIIVERKIRERLRMFKKAFPYPKLRIQYASKVNSNLEILRIVREEGGELDASSVGEIILGLLADFDPSQITFTNLYKSEQDIYFAAKMGVQGITADSIEELGRIERVGKKLDMKINIFIRINPLIKLGEYSTRKQQYGIPITQAKKAINFAVKSENLNLIGLHFHGSYVYNPRVYFIAAEKLLKLAKYAMINKANIKYIDLGGGFPVESDKDFSPEDMGVKFVKHFTKLLQQYGLPKLTLIFEPGKSIVGTAGIGLTRVIANKQLPGVEKVIVDGSTYAFVPDPLIYKCFYDILPANKMVSPRTKVYTIAGCTCDCIDIIGTNRKMPKLEEGDILAIMDCGAYSNVMASNFNTLKKAPMVMITEDDKLKVIRRRDRYSEMFAPELDVLKFADPKELKRLYNLYRVNINKHWVGKQKNGSSQ
ncbi:MAG: diaminopimelate decarboxylase [Candidatus Woesearchaeota archaeon]